jgi:hypothetical protein
MEQARMNSSGTLTFSGSSNSSIYATGLTYNPSSNIGMGDRNPSFKFTVTSSKMKQVKAALFTVTRDPKTNEIIDSEFVKEFWVKQKPGVSFDVAASHANGYAINPDTEVIREILTVSFY